MKKKPRLPRLAQDSIPGCECVLVPTDDPGLLAVDFCPRHDANDYALLRLRAKRLLNAMKVNASGLEMLMAYLELDRLLRELPPEIPGL